MNSSGIVLIEPYGSFSRHILARLLQMQQRNIFYLSEHEEELEAVGIDGFTSQKEPSSRITATNNDGLFHFRLDGPAESRPELSSQEKRQIADKGVSDIWYISSASIPLGQNAKTALINNSKILENTLQSFAEFGPCRWNYINFLYPVEQHFSNSKKGAQNERHQEKKSFAAAGTLSRSEILLAKGCAHHKAEYRIIRPPLIVEDSSNGRHEAASALGDYITSVIRWYAFVTHRVHDYFDCHPLHLYLHGEKTEFDILSTDVVAQKVIECASSAVNDDFVVTIGNKTTIRIDDVFDSLDRILPDLKYEWCHRYRDLNRIDRLFSKMTKSCSAFMTGNKSADGSNTIRVDYPLEKIRSLISQLMQKQEHREIDFETRSDYAFKKHQSVQLACRFKRRLSYLAFGSSIKDKPVVVLLNAMTAKADVWKKIIPFLRNEYRIIIPELRGLNTDDSFPIGDSTDFIMETTKDIEEILAHENADESHMVAWCSGTSAALRYFAENSMSVRSLTLLAGKYRADESYYTEHDQKLLSMARILKKHEELTPKFLELLSEQATNKISPKNSVLKDDFFHFVIKQIDPDLGKIFIGRVLEKEALINYCRLILKADEFDPQDIVRSLNIPCLVIFGDCDHVISPEHSRWLTKIVPQAEAVSLPGATHWLLLENYRETARKIRRFIDAT